MEIAANRARVGEPLPQQSTDDVWFTADRVQGSDPALLLNSPYALVVDAVVPGFGSRGVGLVLTQFGEHDVTFLLYTVIPQLSDDSLPSLVEVDRRRILRLGNGKTSLNADDI